MFGRASWLVVTLLLASCESEPEPPEPGAISPVEQPPPASTNAPRPWGRWTSERVCLELYESGDIDVIFPARAPKTLVMGTFAAREDGDALRLDVTVDRIWTTRFLGPCRRVHRSGEFVEAHERAGFSFHAGESTELRITVDGDALELCQTECVTLTRDEPSLRGRFRIADFENPSQPPRRFAVGEILELDLGRSPHVWFADSPSSFARRRITHETFPLAHDRFRLTLSSEENIPTEELVVRRLRGQRVEVRYGDVMRNTLERQFSESEYDLP